MTALELRSPDYGSIARRSSTSPVAFEEAVVVRPILVQTPPAFASMGDSWVETAQHHIKEAFLLGDDWDLEGAVAVSAHAASSAYVLASDLYDNNLRRPFVSATPLGGIGFEWSTDFIGLSIDVYEDRWEVTVRHPDTGEFWEGNQNSLGEEFLGAVALLTQ